MKKLLIALSAIVIIILILPLAVQAKTGVAISPGKIYVDEPLMPGGNYVLHNVQIINNGDQPSNYEVVLARMQTQEELQIPDGYLRFSPQSFYLEPGKNQIVEVVLDLPVSAVPGDYYGLIEGHPVADETGSTSIGVAAATKLYFTVKTANTLQGIGFAVYHFLVRNSPWTIIVPAVIILGLLIYYLSRRIKLDIKMTKR
jgi:hypothetical protein